VHIHGLANAYNYNLHELDKDDPLRKQAAFFTPLKLNTNGSKSRSRRYKSKN